MCPSPAGLLPHRCHMAGCQYGFEQTVIAGTVPRLPDWYTLMTTDVLWPHIASSLYRMICGLALALVTAVPVGMAAGRSRRWDALLSPFLYIFYSIPKVVFLPVIIVVLGLGDFPKIFIIAITVFFQIAIMVRDAAKAIPEEQVMTMRSCAGQNGRISATSSGRPAYRVS